MGECIFFSSYEGWRGEKKVGVEIVVMLDLRTAREKKEDISASSKRKWINVVWWLVVSSPILLVCGGAEEWLRFADKLGCPPPSQPPIACCHIKPRRRIMCALVCIGGRRRGLVGDTGIKKGKRSKYSQRR